MAKRSKQPNRAWVWPLHPLDGAQRPPNRLVDASAGRPGRRLELPPAGGRARYTIDGEARAPAKGAAYYRPTARELEAVGAALGGEPGNPDWGRLASMVLEHTDRDLAEVRMMRSAEIVAIIASADPLALKRAESARRRRAKRLEVRLTEVVAAVGPESEVGAQPAAMGRFPPPGPADQAGDGARGPVPKPLGWTKAELVTCAERATGRFSDSTFDRVRAAAVVQPSPRGGAGQQRRFSRDELRRLIRAANDGVFRRGREVACAWEELLDA